MPDDIEELFDTIDAGFFTGDGFHNKEACDRIEEYIGRWELQLIDIRKSLTTPT